MQPKQLIYPEDLFLLKEVLWPDVHFYDKEVEIIESAVTDMETYVASCNKAGKDFTMGFLGPACFLVCLYKGITCRILNTSVAEHHLKVVWGESSRFLTTAKQPLLYPHGPLVMNYQEIRRVEEAEAKNPLNYLIGRVSATGEGLQGHHADFTMLIGDEATGLGEEVYKAGQGWAQHMVFIGNTWPTANFFKRHCEAGDLVLSDYLRMNGDLRRSA